MGDAGLNLQLRLVAQRLLDDDREASQRDYLGVIFPIVDRAVARVLRDDTDRGARALDLRAEDAVIPVLEKLLARDFVRRLAESETPGGFLRTSAINATRDLLRKPTPRIRLATGDREVTDDVAIEVDDEETEERGERLAQAEAELESLPDAGRVLLNATLGRFDQQDAAWIAERRRIPLEDARAALLARCEAVNHARAEQERVLTARLEYLATLQTRLERVRALLRERAIVHLPRRAAPSMPVRWPGSSERLRVLDDESLRECELSLVARQRQWARLVAEAREAVGRPLGTQPGWREIAILVGAVASNAPEKDLARAQNTVQVQVNRLLAKLSARVGAEDDDGG